VPTVYETNACRLVAHCGWNAMPSSPPSELALTVSVRKLPAVVTLAVFANTRTRAVPAEPLPFSSTNQRVASFGACNIASG
jgi:hypothetical protein